MTKKMGLSDRGEVQASFQRVQGMRAMRMNFASELSWLAVRADQAFFMAREMRRVITESFGKVRYDNSMRLPFSVKANLNHLVVETAFPEPVEQIVANPEVFLAWSDSLMHHGKIIYAEQSKDEGRIQGRVH